MGVFRRVMTMDSEVSNIINEFKSEFGELKFNFDLTAMEILTKLADRVRDLEWKCSSLESRIESLKESRD